MWLWRALTRLRLDLPLVVLDGMLVVGSFMSLLAVRFEGQIPATYSQRLFAFLPVVILIHLAANLAWGLYGPIWEHASIAEARRVVLAGLTAGLVVFAVNPLQTLPLPRSVALFGSVIATMFIGLVRFQSRLFGWRRKLDRSATRVAVVGAGAAGAAILRELQADARTGLTPVVVVDDAPRTRGRTLYGVPVVPGTDRVDEVVEHHRVSEVLLAVPSADSRLIAAVSEACERVRVPLKVLPPTRELLRGRASVRDARELRIDDLLGRRQVATDLEAVRAGLQGRRVLITGAGGSIGSEIAVQVAAAEPARLLLLDHDETHLHDLAARLGPAGAAELVLADIRDRDALRRTFERLRPEVVFHSAAHKHVPLLEEHPLEAVKTNVLGTDHIVSAARAVGVERLVFISTDKAVRPRNVLGRSKWLGEQIIQAARPPGAPWCSVRFGNVLGSRGSVVPTFAAQIAAGGPVTVTDPRMTRYFISVSEAVELVLQAGVLSSGGEVFMLDMGEPVNILELAERMVRLSGHVVGTEVAVTFVGTRPGEKLSEDLWGAGEACLPTSHPSIVAIDGTRVPADDLAGAVAELRELVAAGADAAAEALLRDVTLAASLDEPRDPASPAAQLGGEVVAAGARLA